MQDLRHFALLPESVMVPTLNIRANVEFSQDAGDDCVYAGLQGNGGEACPRRYATCTMMMGGSESMTWCGTGAPLYPGCTLTLANKDGWTPFQIACRYVLVVPLIVECVLLPCLI
jgi:hypothetical protein